MAEKDYYILKDGEQITVKEAFLLEEGYDFLYISEGKQTKSNPYYVVEVLGYLQSHSLIDSFIYLGKELLVMEFKKGEIY